ncbi:hypothetical protein [Gayadomonas joobiniege]|uniref:hypothetical protein n=1 Tax=Gayadomonas joobiniege TaxID=1234606 RepID=UPI000366EA50|nr:hypothetical protein [Gayadomonas joobiniege]
MRILTICTLIAICLFGISNAKPTKNKNTTYPPLVNQAGYNLGESKRFVCYGAKDGTQFNILNAETMQVVYSGHMLGFQGWFSDFNPMGATNEFIIEVKGHGRSVPFWIADHLIEKVSSKLAYDFFVDARGFASLEEYKIEEVYSGGPTRDGGAFGLETTFEILQYASNPALFDNWKDELGKGKIPDLIELILWHAEFAYKYHQYNGPVKNRHGTLGYEGEPRMNFDYWNTLDQLAAVVGAYHDFLYRYMDEKTYHKYRNVLLSKWQEYDRHKVVRYWTYSRKWVDKGFQEFNEMGNAYGQSVFRNLFMYRSEKALNSPEAEQFLKWAIAGAEDIIAHWDFNNPRHMWWIRNAEHITPQALAFFLLLEPEHAPEGTKKKLAAWAIHMKQKTNNFWKYRVHSEDEWAHPKTKELGGAPALGGSMFAVAHLLNDPQLRKLAWAQVDFVFGVNPVGTHLGNKSQDRIDVGYWPGVEHGWPSSHPNGFGKLGKVRGTLDGSPLDGQFPITREVEAYEGKNLGKDFGNKAYATEGWGISNRGWMATLSFSTLDSHKLTILNANTNQVVNQVNAGDKVVIKLKAALNIDWHKKDTAWIDLIRNGKKQRLALTETGLNTGEFIATFRAPNTDAITVSYGYLGFEKQKTLNIN